MHVGCNKFRSKDLFYSLAELDNLPFLPHGNFNDEMTKGLKSSGMTAVVHVLNGHLDFFFHFLTTLHLM